MTQSDPIADAPAELSTPATVPEPLYSVLHTAVHDRATDIHIDPVDGGDIVRIRVDGVIHEKMPLSAPQGRRLLNLIKVAADLEIDRSFMPLEGLLSWRDETRRLDIRVAIVPAGGGREAAHLRILQPPKALWDIEGLGLYEADLPKVSSALQGQDGLILVAGPTGAGKTTTLYSMATSLELQATITCSVEDPVEFNLPYVRQVQVDESHGLTMYEGLRTLLRMDPDTILVGEIRDEASAVTVARAAMAGRLVIATIHSATSAAAVDALHHLSVPRYVIGGSLKLIITQDLVRKLCHDCAAEVAPNEEQIELFEKYDVKVPEHLHRAVGCEKCNNYGYIGRIGIFEVAAIGNALGREISEGLLQGPLADRFEAIGVRPLLRDALEKATNGVTTMDEVLALRSPETSGKRRTAQVH